MAKHDLVVFSVIRNGIQNGYPFVEAYSSWFNYCDQVFVLDGCSSDGTDVVLRHLSQINPRFGYGRAPWPETGVGGSSIAEFTNQCLETVRSKAERLVYIQADEILERETREKLSRWVQGAVEFTKYVLFWNSFYRVIRFENNAERSRATTWRAIKLFPSAASVRSTGDGLSFELDGVPIAQWDDEVLHYGWNFAVNILQKHANLVNLYSDNSIYRRRAILATRMLSANEHSTALLDALDPQYVDLVRPFLGTHPDCVQHLLGQQCYDPYVGLALLRYGVNW